MAETAEAPAAPEADAEREGFELDGVFYEWHASDTGKDLMLIQNFVDPVSFLETKEVDLAEIPLLLALIATSLRYATNWSVPRILRTIEDRSIGDFVIIGGATSPPAKPRTGARRKGAATGGRRSGA